MLRMSGKGLSRVRAGGGLEIGEQFVHMHACGGVGPGMHVLRND